MSRLGWAVAFFCLLGVGSAYAEDDRFAALPDDPTSAASGLDQTADDPAERRVVARIDLSDQRMYVYVENRLIHTWPVSTARARYVTPVGFYQAEWLSRYHRSRKYDWAPMPWSVFFHGGYAVHGTTDLKRLGRPASHGCVRLHPENAKIFFNLVKDYGKQATLISVVR